MPATRWPSSALTAAVAMVVALALPRAPARAADAEAPSVTVSPEPSSAGEPAPPAAPDEAAEAALRRVLRSGCRDGLPEVRALVDSASAPWAATVTRLCGEVLASAAAAPAVVTAPARPAEGGDAASSNEGRGRLVVWFTLFGIWTGIAADVLFTIDGPRSAIVPPLVGMAAGLGLSLLATAAHPVTNGAAWTVMTGLDYGSINGALWAGGFNLDAQGVVGTALATGVAATSLGVLVARTVRPKHGDIELVRSGLLWGTATGLLGMLAFAPDASGETALRTAGAAMDAGFVAGLTLASSLDLSRNRVLIIDAGTLGGGLAGLGLTWLVLGGSGSHEQALAAGALAGMYAGLAGAALLSRGVGAGDDDQPAVASVPAVYARDAAGRWRWGMPGASPLMDRFGRRVTGVSVNAVAGTF